MFSDYTMKIRGSSNVSGTIDLEFLNISGRICADDWDDRDATVVCRELGKGKGMAVIYILQLYTLIIKQWQKHD